MAMKQKDAIEILRDFVTWYETASAGSSADVETRRSLHARASAFLRGVAERDANRFDDPTPSAIMLHEVDGDDTSFVDARTFADEGLCVYLHADQALVIMSPDQARDAAKALTTMAARVVQAQIHLRGVHDVGEPCSPMPEVKRIHSTET